MLKLENTEVMGWEAAIRGMRNPKNSWEKSDTRTGCMGVGCSTCPIRQFCNTSTVMVSVVGPNDHTLMMQLRNAGTDHRKFMRMIAVYVDITAPLYWWKEFDTYKVGTVANSCSTMHKIADKEFTLEDFSHEHLRGMSPVADHRGDGVVVIDSPLGRLKITIAELNEWRDIYNNGGHVDNYDGTETVYPPHDKTAWWQMIQLLPSSYNQRRTVMLNYEVLANMYRSRRNHKLDEWHTFCDWIEGLPYSELIVGKEADK